MEALPREGGTRKKGKSFEKRFFKRECFAHSGTITENSAVEPRPVLIGSVRQLSIPHSAVMAGEFAGTWKTPNGQRKSKVFSMNIFASDRKVFSMNIFASDRKVFSMNIFASDRKVFSMNIFASDRKAKMRIILTRS